MSLEDLTGADKFIDDLVNTNPASGDPKSEGDDHLRGIKNVLGNQFPNLTGVMSASQAELNHLVGQDQALGSNDSPTFVTVTFGSLEDGAITVTGWIDEDDMASDSAALIPTQQSVKAYADARTDWTVVSNADTPVTAVAGKRYAVDLSAGVVVINLPSMGAGDDGGFVGIKVDENASTSNLTINCADADTIYDGAETDIVVDNDFLETTLVYDHGNTNWIF